MIIAIDGPAGSGKSTTAAEVARRLGFQHLDSGAFYRALTLAALRAGIDPERWPELGRAEVEAFGLEARPGGSGRPRLFLDGEDVSEEIRGADVTYHVSRMARVASVRQWLLATFRELGRDVDLVSDGRDIGTVVFPDAEVKVFLVAEPGVRARRRLLERGVERPEGGDLDSERERLLERDRLDSEREVAPLRPAPDAVLIDTTELEFGRQVEAVVRLARERGAGKGARGGSPG